MALLEGSLETYSPMLLHFSKPMPLILSFVRTMLQPNSLIREIPAGFRRDKNKREILSSTGRAK